MCLCRVCACRSLCACLSSRTVSFVLPFLSSPPRLPLSCGPLSSGKKAVCRVSKDGERYPGCTGVGFDVLAREGVPGEKSLFCAKSLSAIWGHVCSITISLPGQRPAWTMWGLLGRGSGLSWVSQLVSWGEVCFGTGVAWDPSEDPDTGTRGWGGEPGSWPSPAFSLS